MECYDLLRSDWDLVSEIAHFTGKPDYAAQIPSKVLWLCFIEMHGVMFSIHGMASDVQFHAENDCCESMPLKLLWEGERSLCE